jgi:hypothetical protein
MAYGRDRVLTGRLGLLWETFGAIGYQPYINIPGHASMIYEFNMIHDFILILICNSVILVTVF